MAAKVIDKLITGDSEHLDKLADQSEVNAYLNEQANRVIRTLKDDWMETIQGVYTFQLNRLIWYVNLVSDLNGMEVNDEY